MKKNIILFALIFTYVLSLWANQSSHISTQSHKGQINEIIISNSKNTFDSPFFSVGDDGFVTKWTNDNQGEHYQVTENQIKMIALSPVNDYIAIYENNSAGINKVSVWDWKTLKRKYYKDFNDSITSLQFSAKGTYLIVGTASVDGVRFYNAKTGDDVNKIKNNTGIVSYILTSGSEKTAVFYSPAGSVSYYNMKTGELKRKLPVEKNLSQPIIFNHSLFLAGVKDNKIKIVNLNTGKLIASVGAVNPILLSTEKDNDLYYIEHVNKGTYNIKIIKSLDGTKLSVPKVLKNVTGPFNAGLLTVGTKDNSFIYLGNKLGDIYKTEADYAAMTAPLMSVTEDTYSKIYGMIPSKSDFFFLTENSIYKSSYDASIIDKVAETKGQTNITQYNDNKVILWSRYTKEPVVMMDIDSNKTEKLFTPDNYVQALKINTVGNKTYLIDIEGNSSVYLYDIDSKKRKQVYSGTGIQDAVLTHNGNLYVSKSAITNPKVPLLCVNIETLETVPVSEITGDIVYGLSTDGTVIYGIKLLPNGKSFDTYVFSYHTLTGYTKNFLKYSNEDTEAFTYLNGDYLFTNIGKNKIYCYNLRTKKYFSYDRSASIPDSICMNGNRVVILNNDGSISWAATKNGALITDWYLTKDEQWREF